MSVHNGRESQDEYLSACACGCVCFNSSVRLRTPQWRHPHPPDTCLTGYNVTIIWTWHQNNLPMSPWREPGTLLTQPPELTPRLTCKQYTYVLFPPPLADAAHLALSQTRRPLRHETKASPVRRDTNPLHLVITE